MRDDISDVESTMYVWKNYTNTKGKPIYQQKLAVQTIHMRLFLRLSCDFGRILCRNYVPFIHQEKFRIKKRKKKKKKEREREKRKNEKEGRRMEEGRGKRKK